MHAIRAWILQENGKYTACWSSVDTPDRPPATWSFPTEEHARLWVYYEAEQLGCGVQWLDGGQICTAAPV